VKRRLALVLFALACACGHSSQDGATGGSSSSATPAASAPPVASASPSASATASAAAPLAWKGSYKTAVGALAVPSAFAKNHYASNDVTTGVGDGAMQLTIDPTTRRVTGTLDGAIGAAVIEGLMGDGQLSGAVRRKDPTDTGLAGTLLATVSAEKISGTLTLATGDGATLRTGTFTLTPDGH
jgi:hypothetical protein